jgi:hypothetical protein
VPPSAIFMRREKQLNISQPVHRRRPYNPTSSSSWTLLLKVSFP